MGGLRWRATLAGCLIALVAAPAAEADFYDEGADCIRPRELRGLPVDLRGPGDAFAVRAEARDRAEAHRVLSLMRRENIWSRWRALLGWLPEGGRDRYPLVIVSRREMGTASGMLSPYCGDPGLMAVLIARGLSDRRLEQTVAHEAFHAFQHPRQVDFRGATWFHEATAIWAMNKVTRHESDLRQGKEVFLDHPELPLDLFEPDSRDSIRKRHHYAAWMWVRWVEHYFADLWCRVGCGGLHRQARNRFRGFLRGTFERHLRGGRITRIVAAELTQAVDTGRSRPSHRMPAFDDLLSFFWSQHVGPFHEDYDLDGDYPLAWDPPYARLETWTIPAGSSGTRSFRAGRLEARMLRIRAGAGTAQLCLYRMPTLEERHGDAYLVARYLGGVAERREQVLWPSSSGYAHRMANPGSGASPSTAWVSLSNGRRRGHLRIKWRSTPQGVYPESCYSSP